MKFAICNEIYQGWTVEDTLQHAAKTGYDALELAPFTVAPYVHDIPAERRREIREAAARTGIPISGIHWVLVKAEGMHMTSPDPEVRSRTRRYFVDLVDFCADVGGKTIVVGSPQQRNVAEGVSYEQAWTWATEVFQDAVKQAEEREVIICFEPLAPEETNFVNTAEEAIRFSGQFNSPAMKIILDVKAMCSMGKPIPDIIRESWPHFAYFHANDRNLKGPGFGDVDFVPIAAALKEVGYEGYVSVEVFKFEEGPDIIAGKSLEYLKRTFA